ncbi:MAG: GNAT family N-acetyltransferase [Acidobacteriia bacterium]|nr:GNAT family N-acetyltransferase [Terriglobia bacterium]
MAFALRDFRREDFETLWSIDQRCFPPGISYTRLELKFYMHRRGAFTLVVEKAAPELAPETVGFIVAEAGRGGVGHIITIDVLPAVRRYGVGSKLLTAAEDRLRGANCHSVFLETAVDNKTALSFYKRHRYLLMKTVPRYYSNGVDAFILQKDLLSQKGAS